jgi:hypothetical protein
MHPGEIQRAIESLPADAQRELQLWLAQRSKARRAEEREQKRKARIRQTTLRGAVWWSLITLGCFFALEAAIFHSGFYSRWLEPNSSAGFFEGQMAWLAATPPAPQPEIFVIGDSRMAEGFSARTAASTVGGRYAFWNLGVPGASPRAWYYMLRDAIGTHGYPAAVVIAMDRYPDTDADEAPQNRLSDLNYLTGRLRVTDCADFAASMESSKLWMQAMSGCLFRGLPLRQDLYDLLGHWRKRIHDARDFRIHGHGYIDGYEGKSEEMAGLKVDFAKKEIQFPAGTNTEQKDSARATLLPRPAPQTGALYRYRQQWLGRIIDLFRGSKTHVIFFEIPRSPLPLPDSPNPARFIGEAVHQAGVTVLPQDTFRDLEQPELFADGLHLNRRGRAIFSKRLARDVANLLETSR